MAISRKLAELIGALIGDGYIYRRNRKYQIGFVGSPITDKEYFEYIKGLILKEWKKEAKITLRERGLRIVINSKEICRYLIEDLKIPFGKGKGESVIIPSQIFNDLNLVKHTIRGIADTDGTVFVSKKPGIEKYPAIEITTISFKLANQLRSALLKMNFRVTEIRKFKPKNNLMVYRVALYGRKNLQKWVDLIGFSNPYKFNRAIEYLKIK